MATTKKKISIEERKRSKEYINRAKNLLELAELELISPDGHFISVEGIKKLRHKVDQFELIC